MNTVIREIRRIGIVIDTDFFPSFDRVEKFTCAGAHVQHPGIGWNILLVEEVCAKHLPKCNLPANTFFAETSPVNLSVDRHYRSLNGELP